MKLIDERWIEPKEIDQEQPPLLALKKDRVQDAPEKQPLQRDAASGSTKHRSYLSSPKSMSSREPLNS